MDESAEQRFRRLYRENYENVLAFALRRVPDRGDAHDVAAETFLVLWRRLADAPPDAEVPLWLYGVARRVVANRIRTTARKERLTARLGQLVTNALGADEVAAGRLHAASVLDSLRRLNDADREVLLLAAWEGLSTADIATVLGCSENAAAIRLHRARKRLAEAHRKELGRSGDRGGNWLQLRQPREEGHEE